MSVFANLIKCHQILKDRRRPISLKLLAEKMEVDERTVKRVLSELRNSFNAEIPYNRQLNGYSYDVEPNELPGFWFNDKEAYALLMSSQLLGQVDGELFKEVVAPAKKCIEGIINKNKKQFGVRLDQRVSLEPITYRPLDAKIFRTVAESVFSGMKLAFKYHNRYNDKESTRKVSPIKLLYYKSNWYLDAWEDSIEEFRTFSIDRITSPEILAETATTFPEEELDNHFAAAFGIFAGPATETAKLRFSSKAAKWVRDETWHKDQNVMESPDGGLLMEIPYNEPYELIMHILSYGAEVEVLKPASLRKEISRVAADILNQYEADV